MTSPALTISADHARRFLVTRHLLAPPRDLPAEPESVLRAIQRLGGLQFDPLEVPGARNHELVLHARVAGYRRGWCEQWLYGPDRRLIEIYNKSLNILPLDELRHYRIGWTRTAKQLDDGILREQATVAEAILARLHTDGPLSTAAFAEHGHAVDWWWAPTRAARAVMEALFVAGRIGIARRDGNRRHYDLIERIVPPELLDLHEPEEEALTHRLLSRYRGVGLMGTTTPTDLTYGTGTAAERVRRRDRLVEDGALLPVEVEGLRGLRYVLAEEEGILDQTGDPGSMPPPAVSFVAALDPIVWDRRLLRDLWGFDYLWEVYVPAAKRRWGYYVLPILFGDRFVGRIEPRLDRPSGTLRILGIWFEPAFAPLEAHGFLAALRDAVEAYRCLVGAGTVAWPRTKAGRAVAGALRRVA